MTEATSQRIWELILQAYPMGEGDAKIAVLEEATRLADICGDLKLAANAREFLIHAATFGGAPEKALVAFSWMLAQYDRGGLPDEAGESTVLWQYKWILDSIANFPQIGKAQILEMLDDMAARYRRAGYSLRPNYLMRYRLYKFWDEAEAVRYFHKGHETPRDDMSDCRACELNDVVGFALLEGDDARAVELASPILEGDLRCASIPKITLANLLLPLVRLGRMDEAVNLHREGYRLVTLAAKGSLSSAADHLEFLVVTENFDRAVRIFEKHLTDASAVADAATKFDYYLASWFLFDRLGESGRATLKLQHVSRSLPFYEAGGTYPVARLAAWFLEQCEALAARFDARNESDYHARRIRDSAALGEATRPHPIKDVDEFIA